MGRFQGDLPERSFRFAKRIIGLIDGLPNNVKGWEIGPQLLRSGTSIGANVREADHAISRPEFIQKCSIARKEAAETLYWLQLCKETELLGGEALEHPIGEADELVRVLGAVVKSTQSTIRAPAHRTKREL